MLPAVGFQPFQSLYMPLWRSSPCPPLLDDAQVHPAIVREVQAAVAAHHDIDYGNYFSQWRERNALKMWAGWSTLPMVFVCGTLVGGATDLHKLMASGEHQSDAGQGLTTASA